MHTKLVFILGCFFLNACSTLTHNPTISRDNIYPIDYPLDEEHDGSPALTETKPLPKFVNTAEIPQSQISAKQLDLSWVAQQEPSHMTIWIKSDHQPLHISQTLMKLPKDQRAAAIKYQQNGQTYYTGTYGSFESQEQAEQALQKLPEDIKNNAQITYWNNIQALSDQ